MTVLEGHIVVAHFGLVGVLVLVVAGEAAWQAAASFDRAVEHSGAALGRRWVQGQRE